MLTQTSRPQTFDEVAGQKLNINILKAIVKNPKQSPRSLIFQGQFGTGKSTMARIFARALNCLHPHADGSPCMRCDNCKEDILNTYYYQEYDSAVVGNVDKVRELRDTFQYTVDTGYKVILFDEIHLASSTAQSALLKVIEEVSGNVFFIFATTDVDKVLSTIRSRSLELRFDIVEESEILKNLRSVADKNGIQIEDKVLKVIADRSGGHMRNAHMLLDKYALLGEKDFLSTASSAREQIAKYLIGLLRKDKKKVLEAVTAMAPFPIADLKADYGSFLNDLMKASLGMDVNDSIVQRFVEMSKNNTSKLVRLCMAKWIMESFENDITFQTALLALYQMTAGG